MVRNDPRESSTKIEAQGDDGTPGGLVATERGKLGGIDPWRRVGWRRKVGVGGWSARLSAAGGGECRGAEGEVGFVSGVYQWIAPPECW